MQLTPRTTAFLVGAVVVGVLAGLLSAVVLRQMIDGDLYNRGFLTFGIQLVTGVLGLVTVAVSVVAALATRVPFAGVATAAVVAAGMTVAQPVVVGGSLTIEPRGVLYALATVASVLAVDVVVVMHAGKPLPLLPVVLATLVIAVVGLVVTLVGYVTYAGGFDVLRAVLQSPTFLFDLLVVDPVGLVLAGLLGWSLRPREQSLRAAG